MHKPFFKYLVYPDGSIYSQTHKRFLKPFGQTGYLRVDMMTDRPRKHKMMVHRIVMMAHNPVEGMDKLEVDHIDGNRANNHISNLRWVSHDDNIKYGIERRKSMLESAFQKKVTGILSLMHLKEKLPIYYFVKEAGAIRGIPDVIICCNGFFFAWELKRDRSESEKTTGRIVLQRYTLQRIGQAQGYGRIVHPENLEECLAELRATCNLSLRCPSTTPLVVAVPLQSPDA